MPYDGFLIISATNEQTIYVNNISFILGTVEPSGVFNSRDSTTIPVKKGDSVYATAIPNVYSRARFYKHP